MGGSRSSWTLSSCPTSWPKLPLTVQVMWCSTLRTSGRVTRLAILGAAVLPGGRGSEMALGLRRQLEYELLLRDAVLVHMYLRDRQNLNPHRGGKTVIRGEELVEVFGIDMSVAQLVMARMQDNDVIRGPQRGEPYGFITEYGRDQAEAVIQGNASGISTSVLSAEDARRISESLKESLGADVAGGTSASEIWRQLMGEVADPAPRASLVVGLLGSLKRVTEGAAAAVIGVQINAILMAGMN